MSYQCLVLFSYFCSLSEVNIANVKTRSRLGAKAYRFTVRRSSIISAVLTNMLALFFSLKNKKKYKNFLKIQKKSLKWIGKTLGCLHKIWGKINQTLYVLSVSCALFLFVFCQWSKHCKCLGETLLGAKAYRFTVRRSSILSTVPPTTFALFLSQKTKKKIKKFLKKKTKKVAQMDWKNFRCLPENWGKINQTFYVLSVFCALFLFVFSQWSEHCKRLGEITIGSDSVSVYRTQIFLRFSRPAYSVCAVVLN